MKIGIVTPYYNSNNYGGNLQAYALCAVLKNLGFDAEQISYSSAISLKERYERNKSITFMKKVKKGFKRFKIIFTKSFINPIFNKKTLSNILIRKERILQFNREIIPHSLSLYNDENIADCLEKYDSFITGSDQVWNPKCWNKGYRLEFVPPERIKMSYAASISQTSLSEDDLLAFKKMLADYNAVSVRESDSVSLIQGVSPIEVEFVLDPTMLLLKEDWDEICDQRQINEKYLFCYFLGEDKVARKLATQYGKRHGLKIVNLPHLVGNIISADKRFGDILLYDVSPNRLISLIKHAEIVFTDSFHATVFSNIYKKQYFVFNRHGHKELSTRIYTLTALANSKNRFCDTKDKLSMDYLEKQDSIDYANKQVELEKMREKSLNFLKRNLSRLIEKNN